MITQAERIRYVIQHRDGAFLSIRGELKSDFMSVDRWVSVEDIQRFLYGYYAPHNPSEYRARPVVIKYELMEDDSNVQQE